jgi:hypothetical protein
LEHLPSTSTHGDDAADELDKLDKELADFDKQHANDDAELERLERRSRGMLFVVPSSCMRIDLPCTGCRGREGVFAARQRDGVGVAVVFST